MACASLCALVASSRELDTSCIVISSRAFSFAHVELFINPSGDARSWRAITSVPLDYRDGVAQIALAPLRTRLLRLSFSATVGGGELISLGRIGLLQ